MHDPNDAFRTFEIVERALDLAPGDREPFVRREAGSDVALVQRALNMLHDAEAGDPVAAPASPEPLRLVTSTATAELLRRLDGSARFDDARYEVHETLGSGGMGKVLRVEDKHLKRTLAMKMPHARAAQTLAERQQASVQLGRFLEEAQVTSQLDHPGVVPVHDLGLDKSGQVYFLMRRVIGENARDVFGKAREQRDGWTTSRALEVVLKICDTMAYAHQKGVLHRDLKPDNIRVGAFGEVYVMDWGLAKIGDEEDRHDLRVPAGPAIASDRKVDAQSDPGSSVVTMDGRVIGTVFYMSPEQATSQPLDHRTDIYAIGATVYELLAGKPPYHDPDSWPVDILERVRKAPPTRIEDLVTGAPAELVAIVEKAMARAPDLRYASATALAADLRAFLDQRVVAAYRTGALVELKMWVRRNRSLAASLAAVVAVLVAGVVATSNMAGRNADLARAMEAKVRDFDQLSGVPEYQQVLNSEQQLYPAWPHKIPDMQRWLDDACGPLLAKLPGIERTIESLRPSVSRPGRDPTSHQRYAEWLDLGKFLTSLRYAQSIRSGQHTLVAVEPTLEQRDSAAQALAAAAWSRVAPGAGQRAFWQEEPLGLSCAQLAVEKSTEAERAMCLDMLAWALVANGQDAEAKARSAEAIDAAAVEDRDHFRREHAALLRAIDQAPAILARESAKHETLGAELHAPTLEFASDRESDQFLHDALRELRANLERLQKEQKVAVELRFRWAKSIAELTRAHPNATVQWAEVREQIRTSPAYAGQQFELRDEDVLGLVPLGKNPNTGYFEFYHLRSAWDGTSDPESIAIPQRRADGSIEVTGDTGIVFVLLPGGKVKLGSQAVDESAPYFYRPRKGEEPPHDEPLHYVTLSPFFMALHEVTQGQWARMSGGSMRDPSQCKAGNPNWIGGLITLAHPVDSVDWNTCTTMLTRHGLVLPTEAQWEYACRASTSTPWICALDADLADVANVADATCLTHETTWILERWRDGQVTHAPAGSFRANGFGIYDMHGNVCEWCQDWYSDFGYGTERAGDGLQSVTSTERSYRGGAFSKGASLARSAHRLGWDPSRSDSMIGFRAARRLKP